MTSKKYMRLLINYRQGSISSCAKHLDRKPTMVIHEEIRPIDLRDFRLEEEQGERIRKRFPKQADEVFLCRSCWEIDYYHNDSKYEEYLGQANFTSCYIRDWVKRDYKLIDDIVESYK